MNIRIITLAALTLALSTGPLFAKSSADQQARMYQTERVYLPSGSIIEEGMAPTSVLHRIGDPHLALTPEIWIYHYGYAPKHEEAKANGCRQLVIVFTDGQVSDIYFANQKARNIIQARVEAGPGDSEMILATVSEQPDGTLAMK